MERFSTRTIRGLGVALVVTFLVAGAAFATDALFSDPTDSPGAAPTDTAGDETPEALQTPGAHETPEADETPEATDDHDDDDDADETPEATDDHDDDDDHGSDDGPDDDDDHGGDSGRSG